MMALAIFDYNKRLIIIRDPIKRRALYKNKAKSWYNNFVCPSPFKPNQLYKPNNPNVKKY